MISAFLGVSGRTVAAHAALLLANAHARVDGVVSLVRVIAPGDATLSPSFASLDGIVLVEREASTQNKVAAIVTEEVEAARQVGRSVVLDLPSTCHADPRIRERVAVMVMAVGQAPLDEQGALALVAADAVPSRGRTKQRAPGLGAAPCWLLGCSRSGGGPAAAAFERAMTQNRDTQDVARPRILPVTLPMLSRAEAAGLIDGGLNARMLAAGVILLAILRIIEADPGIERVETAAIDAALGEDGPASLLPDDRVPGRPPARSRRRAPGHRRGPETHPRRPARCAAPRRLASRDEDGTGVGRARARTPQLSGRPAYRHVGSLRLGRQVVGTQPFEVVSPGCACDGPVRRRPALAPPANSHPRFPRGLFARRRSHVRKGQAACSEPTTRTTEADFRGRVGGNCGRKPPSTASPTTRNRSDRMPSSRPPIPARPRSGGRVPAGTSVSVRSTRSGRSSPVPWAFTTGAGGPRWEATPQQPSPSRSASSTTTITAPPPRDLVMSNLLVHALDGDPAAAVVLAHALVILSRDRPDAVELVTLSAQWGRRPAPDRTMGTEGRPGTLTTCR